MCESSIPSKRCSKCTAEKPATREFFSPSPDQRYGLGSWCKTCSRDHKRATDAIKKEARRVHVQPGHKICTGCKSEIPADAEHFYKQKTGRDGLTSRCKSCIIAANKRVYDRKVAPAPAPTGTMKQCTACGAEKPATTEFFVPIKTGVHGLFARCRECTQIVNRGRYHRLEPSAPPEGATLRCTACQEDLPATLEYFFSNKSGKFGLKSRCRECQCRIMRGRYATVAPVPAPPNTRKQCTTCGKVKPATPRHFRTHRLGRYGLGPICKECTADSARRWRVENPEIVRANGRRRRAREYGAAGSHSAADVRAQLNSQKGRCYWCRRHLKESGKGKFHVDHLIPLARGGGDGPENIVCACPFCNHSRRDKLPHEWTNRLI